MATTLRNSSRFFDTAKFGLEETPKPHNVTFQTQPVFLEPDFMSTLHSVVFEPPTDMIGSELDADVPWLLHVTLLQNRVRLVDPSTKCVYDRAEDASGRTLARHLGWVIDGHIAKRSEAAASAALSDAPSKSGAGSHLHQWLNTPNFLQRMEAEFKRRDVDGDRMLDRRELRNVVHTLLPEANAVEIAFVEGVVDINNDGEVSMAEFRQAVQELRAIDLDNMRDVERHIDNLRTRFLARNVSLRALFQQHDRDGSGCLDMRELCGFLMAMDPQLVPSRTQASSFHASQAAGLNEHGHGTVVRHIAAYLFSMDFEGAGGVKLSVLARTLNLARIRTVFRKPVWKLQTIYAKPGGSAQPQKRDTAAGTRAAAEEAVLVEGGEVEQVLQGSHITVYKEDAQLGMPIPYGRFDGLTVDVVEPAAKFGEYLKEQYSDEVVPPSSGRARKNFTQRVAQQLAKVTPYKVKTKEHSKHLKAVIARMHTYIRTGVCPLTVLLNTDTSRRPEGFITVDAAYSDVELSAGDAPVWALLRRGQLASVLSTLAPVGRVLTRGLAGRLEFRDLLDHVRCFTHVGADGREALSFAAVLQALALVRASKVAVPPVRASVRALAEMMHPEDGVLLHDTSSGHVFDDNPAAPRLWGTLAASTGKLKKLKPRSLLSEDALGRDGGEQALRRAWTQAVSEQGRRSLTPISHGLLVSELGNWLDLALQHLNESEDDADDRLSAPTRGEISMLTTLVLLPSQCDEGASKKANDKDCLIDWDDVKQAVERGRSVADVIDNEEPLLSILRKLSLNSKVKGQTVEELAQRATNGVPHATYDILLRASRAVCTTLTLQELTVLLLYYHSFDAAGNGLISLALVSFALQAPLGNITVTKPFQKPDWHLSLFGFEGVDYLVDSSMVEGSGAPQWMAAMNGCGVLYRLVSLSELPEPFGVLVERSNAHSPMPHARRRIFEELRPYTQELGGLLETIFNRYDPTHLGFVRSRHVPALLHDLLAWPHFRPYAYGQDSAEKTAWDKQQQSAPADGELFEVVMDVDGDGAVTLARLQAVLRQMLQAYEWHRVEDVVRKIKGHAEKYHLPLHERLKTVGHAFVERVIPSTADVIGFFKALDQWSRARVTFESEIRRGTASAPSAADTEDWQRLCDPIRAVVRKLEDAVRHIARHGSLSHMLPNISDLCAQGKGVMAELQRASGDVGRVGSKVLEDAEERVKKLKLAMEELVDGLRNTHKVTYRQVVQVLFTLLRMPKREPDDGIINAESTIRKQREALSAAAQSLQVEGTDCLLSMRELRVIATHLSSFDIGATGQLDVATVLNALMLSNMIVHDSCGRRSAARSPRARVETPSALPSVIEVEYCDAVAAGEYLVGKQTPTDSASLSTTATALQHAYLRSSHSVAEMSALAKDRASHHVYRELRPSARLYRLNQKSLQLEYAGDLMDNHLVPRGDARELFVELSATLKARGETFSALLKRTDTLGRGVLARPELQSVLRAIKSTADALEREYWETSMTIERRRIDTSAAIVEPRRSRVYSLAELERVWKEAVANGKAFVAATKADPMQLRKGTNQTRYPYPQHLNELLDEVRAAVAAYASEQCQCKPAEVLCQWFQLCDTKRRGLLDMTQVVAFVQCLGDFSIREQRTLISHLVVNRSCADEPFWGLDDLIMDLRLLDYVILSSPESLA